MNQHKLFELIIYFLVVPLAIVVPLAMSIIRGMEGDVQEAWPWRRQEWFGLGNTWTSGLMERRWSKWLALCTKFII